MLVSIAAIDLLRGRRSRAVEHLEQAFAAGFRLDDFHFTRLDQDPLFAPLRGDRRFERLVAQQNAHLARERREVQALGLL